MPPRSVTTRRLPLGARALVVSLGLASALASTAFAFAPPIACVKARSTVDREICGSAELLAMDREIAALYDRGLAQVNGGDRHRMATSQQAFLRRRGGCDWAAHHSAHPGVAVEECVRGAMERRVRALREIADHGRF